MTEDKPEFQRIEFCDATCKSMGELMFAWGILERELDLGFAALFNINPTLATCITANLGTMAKVDMLRAGLSMLKPCLGDELVDEGVYCLKEIGKLTGAARTPVAHGQPLVFGDADGSGWHWVRYRARSDATISVYDTPESHWRYHSVLAMLHAESWAELVGKIYERIRSLTAQQIDDACSIDSVVVDGPFRDKPVTPSVPT